MRRVGNVEGTSVIVTEQKSLEKIKQMVLGGQASRLALKPRLRNGQRNETLMLTWAGGACKRHLCLCAWVLIYDRPGPPGGFGGLRGIREPRDRSQMQLDG
jgi:hypothetical protein